MTPSDRPHCEQCELPILGRGLQLAVAGELRWFCCYGCYLVLQVTGEPGVEGQAQAILLRLGLATFFSMNVMMFSLPTYFPHIYGESTAEPAFAKLLNAVALVLAMPVFGLLGLPVLVQALRDLRSFAFRTEALVSVGTLAAFCLSAWNTAHGGPTYFDTVSMLLVLATAGRYLEARARADAGAALNDARDAICGIISVWRDGQKKEVAPADLRVGDVIELGPGSLAPADARVLEGNLQAEDSSETGARHPQPIGPGKAINAGAMIVDGFARAQVIAVGSADTLGRIRALAEEALQQRGPVQRLADTAAVWFLPFALSIGGASFSFWAWRGDFDTALLSSLAVLVVACPCAFGIATPVAVWTAMTLAAGRRIFLRSPETLETLAAVRRIWFDYTGTLTRETLQVDRVIPVGAFSAQQALAIAQALERGMPHPIARAFAAPSAAVVRFATDTASHVDVRVSDPKSQPGLGVEGAALCAQWRIGSLDFAMAGTPIAPGVAATAREIATRGVPIVLSRRDQTRWQAAALFDLAAPLRNEAVSVLTRLRTVGYSLGIVTGGSQVDPAIRDLVSEVAQGLSPAGKLELLRRRRGRESFLMVGDGLNDCAAIAAADVGIALGGARMTAESATVCMEGTDLTGLPWLLATARRARRIMLQNLAFAFVYNGTAIALAASGRLTPVWAALAMIFSSLTIVANARRLRAGPPPSRESTGSTYPTIPYSP